MTRTERRELVDRVRQELGLTQAEFAVRVGVSRDAVASWACGRNPVTDASLRRLSVRLGRNLVDGTLAPVSEDDFVRPLLAAYETKLRRLLRGGRLK